MKLVQFTNSMHSPVWVNPDLVTTVSEHFNKTTTGIWLAGDTNCLTVKETPEQVIDRLQNPPLPHWQDSNFPMSEAVNPKPVPDKDWTP